MTEATTQTNTAPAATTTATTTQTTASNEQSNSVLTSAPAQQPNQVQSQESSQDYPDGDWRKALPQEIKFHESIKKYNDVAALAKGYVNAQKLIGADKVPLPGKYATPEDWQEFYDRVGRPPLDKYEVKLPKDSQVLSEEMASELKKIAHKAGILPAQLEEVFNWYDQKTKETIEKTNSEKLQEVAQGLDNLKKEWGKAYDKNVGAAKHLIQKFGDKDLVDMLNQTGLTNNDKLIKLLGKIGTEMFKEDILPDGSVAGRGVFAPKEALQKANEIISSPNHPYNDPSHPKHYEAKKEVADLFDMAYPQAQA